MSNESLKNNTRVRLLKEHNPNEMSTWEIRGEDPNCDLGGSHSEPLLETVSGTYRNVVEYALNLPGFYSWGSGGRIINVKPPTNILNVDRLVDSRVVALESERSKLRSRLEEIEREIQNIVRGR
jgi:hypothetical protein